MKIPRYVLVTLLASAWTITAAGQDAQPQRPVFHGGVDLLTVDVNAVDKDGEPVRGLTPGDFVVEVGGTRRTVARADFIDFSAGTAAGTAATREATDVTSNQSGVAAPEPRAILLLVDDESFTVPEGRPVFLKLADMMTNAFPGDAIGFVPLSGRAPAVEFTKDRRPVIEALRSLLGRRVATSVQTEIAVVEALEIARGNSFTMDRVLERESQSVCAGIGAVSPRAAVSPNIGSDPCRRLILSDAVAMTEDIHASTHRTLRAFARQLEQLGRLPGIKYALLVSQGIFLDEDIGIAEEMARIATAASVTLQVLHIDRQEVGDVGRARISPRAPEDVRVRGSGLESVAAAAGGNVEHTPVDPELAFGRIRREVATVYRLGVESTPEDATGGSRRIQVTCARPGVTVRTHRQVMVPEKRSAESVQDRLTRALQSPGTERAIALRVATFAYRGEKDEMQIVASVETDTMATGLHLAFAVRDKQGKAISAAELNPESIIVEKDAPPLAVFRTSVEPGDYTVKIAAIDRDGRVGSVVRPISIVRRPVAGGSAAVVLSDLLVLPAGVEIARMRPSARIAQGSRQASVYFEIYANQAGTADVPIVLEIADSPEGPALAATKTSVSVKYEGSPPRAGARMSFSPAALPAGHYFARVSVAGIDAKAIRGFTVSTGGAAALLADEARVLVPPFTVDRFLSPELMRVLSGRLSQYGQKNDTARTAARSLMDGSWRSVSAKSGEPVVDATVSGLQALTGGRPGDAEKFFRDALNEDPEFTVALTLAGAAWAAVGRDVEAARAWRTSLATGVDAPFIYTDVASALLRQGDVKGLDEFLREVAEPGAAGVPLARAAAIAAAISGDRRRAVTALAPWVDAHPDDHETAFLLLLALYELKSFEKDVSAGADLQVRAKEYINRGGARSALVARWLK